MNKTVEFSVFQKKRDPERISLIFKFLMGITYSTHSAATALGGIPLRNLLSWSATTTTFVV